MLLFRYYVEKTAMVDLHDEDETDVAYEMGPFVAKLWYSACSDGDALVYLADSGQH